MRHGLIAGGNLATCQAPSSPSDILHSALRPAFPPGGRKGGPPHRQLWASEGPGTGAPRSHRFGTRLPIRRAATSGTSGRSARMLLGLVGRRQRAGSGSLRRALRCPQSLEIVLQATISGNTSLFYTLPAPQVQGPPMACELSRSHKHYFIAPRGGSGPTHTPGEPPFSGGDPRPPNG
jgi:hypothetical protein